jgi:hypothetical protein
MKIRTSAMQRIGSDNVHSKFLPVTFAIATIVGALKQFLLRSFAVPAFQADTESGL